MTGESTPPASIARARRWRRTRRILTAVSVTLIILLILGAWRAYTLAKQKPSWWSPADSSSAAVADTARELENRITEQIHRIRPRPVVERTGTGLTGREVEGAEWSVSIPQDAVNAWMAARFPQWLANQDPPIGLPDNLSTLQVNFQPDRVTLATTVTKPGAGKGPEAEQFIGITFAPRVDADGALWLPAQWVQLGRLDLPASWVVEKIREQAASAGGDGERDLMGELFDAFAGKRALASPTLIHLADGRVLRIISMRVVARALEVTCRTEAAGR